MPSSLRRIALSCCLAALAACSGSDATDADTGAEDSGPVDTSTGDTTETDGGDPGDTSDAGGTDSGDPDVSTDPDAAPDATEDATPDTDPDVAADADPDATTDAAPDADPPRCGDGTRDPGELCDGDDLDDATCLDFAFDGGELACAEGCDRYVFDACTRDMPPRCGDGTRDDGELCDGDDLDGVTCEGLGFAGGTLRCREDCSGFVLDACGDEPTCGDGTRDDGELCDGDDLDGTTCVDLEFDRGELACNDACDGFDTSACEGDTDPVCGDGTRDAGELCDGEDLAADCTDLGFDAGTLACDDDCAGYVTTGCTRDGPECGDGTRDAGELCDGDDVGDSTCEGLGFDAGTLACAPGCAGFDTTGCTRDAVCGDGTAAGDEVCDRDDLSDETCRSLGFAGGTLRCAMDCTAFDTDACTRPATCGNDVREGDEVCDGTSLGGETCEGRGFEGGDLACRGDCAGFDESDCIAACVPACGGRECGPDPTCGDSCGTCDTGERCSDAGRCELDGDRGPRILRFNTDVFDISEGETVTFSAVVTDPDGIDDVIGGTLDDPATGRSYGAFSTAAGEGSYALTLTWGQIHRVRTIDFTEDTSRSFEAVFFDVSGSDATARIELTLTCDGDFACDGACTPAGTTSDCLACDDVCPELGLCGAAGCTCGPDEGVCDGTCTDLTTTTDCGDCGNVCATGGACVDGACTCGPDEGVCDGICTDLTTTTDCGTCGEACPLGAACVDGGCACPAGEVVCGGVCTDITTTDNCGGCGLTCADGGVCDGGACACPGELDAVCDGACTDLDTDSDCGACDNACLDGATCEDRACTCDRPDMYCGADGCLDPARTSHCGGCDIECAANETCTSTGCRRPRNGEIRINADGFPDFYSSGTWYPMCNIFRITHAEAACESLGMDLARMVRDQTRPDVDDGAGAVIDYFCDDPNLSSLESCGATYDWCGAGPDSYARIDCIASRTPAEDGEGRIDADGRAQVFYDDRWWTLTTGFTYFREDEARVFCRSMGMTYVSHATGDPTTVDDGLCLGAFECQGTEADLTDCVEYGWGQVDCGIDRLDRIDITCR